MAILTLNDLPDFLQQHLSQRILTAGEILLQQGEAAQYLYWLKSGQMRLVSFVNQQMITHYFVNAGEFLGESVLYIPTYGCTAIAETQAEVIAIPVGDFAAALQQSPALAKRYLEILTHRFYGVKSLLELRSITSARDRLLHYLMQRRPLGERSITLDKPFRAIASELAITPEALSRILSRLQMDGIISRKRRTITFSQDWLDDFAEY